MFSAANLVLVWKPERNVGLPEKLLRDYFGPRVPSASHSQRAKKEETFQVVRLKTYHIPATTTTGEGGNIASLSKNTKKSSSTSRIWFELAVLYLAPLCNCPVVSCTELSKFYCK